MTLEADPLFEVALKNGLKPHGHGIPETLWIEDRWGQCHPVEEMDKVLMDHAYDDELGSFK